MSTEGSFAEGLVGVVLDERYRLDALLGEGGMGSVFRAHHLAMDRKVAVKLLKPHLTQDAAAAQRFLREARATLKVSSPHAVKVLDFGITPHGDYYMALEYLDGRTVQRELEVDGPFAPARVLHVARHALDALAAAHRSGLVHRDIKPDNILLMRVGDDPDHAKLLDFGVAKLMEGTATSDRSRLALTAAGMVFGTPEFMSPEQACGHALDGRSDLYSLAATMFVMLTGRALFEGKSAIELLTQHARTPPPHLAAIRPELAGYPELDSLLQRCLAKHRDQRPRTAEELDQLLAGLAPHVERGGGVADDGVHDAVRGDVPAQPAAPRPPLLSPSSYVEALPRDTVEPGAPLRPPTPHPHAVPSPTTEGVAVIPARRRGLLLVLGALAVIAVIATAIGLASRRRPVRAGASSEPVPGARVVMVDAALVDAIVDLPVRAPADAGIPVPPVDAGIPVPPVDAGRSRPVDAGGQPRPPGRNLVAEAHLASAEAAMRAGNRLRQLAEADLALKAAPRHVRATYLLADALIKTGDLDRGCQYLRSLGRNPQAQARAHAASCPTD